MSLEEFDELKADGTITTEELDSMVRDMAESKADYEKHKAISTEKYHIYEEKRAKLITTLRAANKGKYVVDGVGTVSVTEKLKVKTPKNPEDKGAFFAWLNQKFGHEGFLSYTGINYQTLQALYNTEFEEAKLNGYADNFHIPGVGNPEAEYGLSFRK